MCAILLNYNKKPYSAYSEHILEYYGNIYNAYEGGLKNGYNVYDCNIHGYMLTSTFQ